MKSNYIIKCKFIALEFSLYDIIKHLQVLLLLTLINVSIILK